MINAMLGDKYRIIAELGKGGFATVYRALDTFLEREVAIKILDPYLMERDPTLVERFRREAKAMAQLKHPNIITLYETGMHEGRPFIVMPYLPGPTLSELLDEHEFLPPRQVVSLAAQIAAALDYAHQQDIIHRDVKLVNILLDDKGQAILTDFGIAKLINASISLTETGIGLGTPYYVAPEQWVGDSVDYRSDLYGLGVIVYEMLTGQVPFSGEVTRIMHGHVYEEPPSPLSLNPKLPPKTEAVLKKALAKRADDRYQSGAEFVEALDKACPPPTRSKWTLLLVTMLVILLAAGLGAVFLMRNGTISIEGAATVVVPPVIESESTATNTPPPPTPTRVPTNTPPPTSTSTPTSTDTPPPLVIESISPNPTPTDAPPTLTTTEAITTTNTLTATEGITPTNSLTATESLTTTESLTATETLTTSP